VADFASGPDRAENWDIETDILVVGSGAGALTAAVTAADNHADVLVIEKSDQFGGTSATSGGGVWIPASHAARAAGAQDTPEEGFAYIKALAGDAVEDARIQSFVGHGPAMLEYIERVTTIEFVSVPYTDYHAELPGGKHGYRTHECKPIHADALGEDFEKLRAPHPGTMLFGVVPWTMYESAPMITQAPGWRKTLARVLWRYVSDVPQRLRSSRSRFLVFGNALVGQLKLALDKKGGKLVLNTALQTLLYDGDRVVGAVAVQNGKQLRILARKGVILGAGGFERNGALRTQYLPHPTSPDWSGSQQNNTGDALTAAQAIDVDTDLLDEAWWAPVIKVPDEPRARPLFYERALPGCIMVNQAGQRYMNEAASYHMAGKRMLEANTEGAGTAPSWIVFDQRFRSLYPMGPVMPFPDFMLRAGVKAMLVKADTLEALGAKLKLPPGALAATVQRFNENAQRGEDPDFGRGHQAYDRYYGDPKVTPNPNLYPLLKAPFYAMPVYPGDIGTKGGIRTDANAQALNTHGQAVRGLYAIGNTAASVMGGSYPGAGATLGPAMTFGYVAARHALRVND
jgi:3-oxosteroid 1-dehydrogenase